MILNWNGWRDTIECLESINQLEYPNIDVVIVDNGSKDESVEMLEAYAAGRTDISSRSPIIGPVGNHLEIDGRNGSKQGTTEVIRESVTGKNRLAKTIAVLKNQKNFGFSEGNNIGMRHALETFAPDYLLLLNNDVVVDRRMVSELVDIGEQFENAGILGPKTLLYDHPDTIQLTYNRINLSRGTILLAGEGERDSGKYDEMVDTDYVPGSCFLIKEGVVKDIGLLDSSFFCYWEETDYCLRARSAGYRTVYCPKARIWHKVSRTAGRLNGFTTYYMTRNMFWFLRRHSTKRQYRSFLIYFFGYKFWRNTAVILKSDGRLVNLVSNVRGVFDGLKPSEKKVIDA